MLSEHPSVGRRSQSGRGPEEPPSRPERRQLSTPPSSPAIELTAIRLEGCPSDAARQWSCSQASALTLRRGPAVGADRQLERPASGKVVAAAEEVDQDPSTSSMALAYKDPSLQKLRVSVNDPSCGMMAPAATGVVVRVYEPLNL